MLHTPIVMLLVALGEAWAREGVPNRIGIVLGIGELSCGVLEDFVAAHEVAVGVPLEGLGHAAVVHANVEAAVEGALAELRPVLVAAALEGPRGLARVEGEAHAEVHALLPERLGGARLHLETDDLRDSELPRASLYDLIVKVPQDPGKVCGVHVHGRVNGVRDGPVHVERVQGRIARLKEDLVVPDRTLVVGGGGRSGTSGRRGVADGARAGECVGEGGGDRGGIRQVVVVAELP
mmetsp:Transcript_24975/g.58613  ORF Transcript_24975/g.58613 Transcript_24975/m.58613 type:complete len:236 (-) Transcript_24975:204-911(-)